MRVRRTSWVLVGLALCLAAAPQRAHAFVWSDQFNGNGAPNWNFDVGGGGWGNNELEYYREGGNNAWQYGGRLQIQAKRENYGGRAYTSARINTSGRVSFGPYGYMQARIQMPGGQGMWPAFWMLGTNIGSVGWPACGEIDIMEHVNSQGTALGSIHWMGPSSQYDYSPPAFGVSYTNYHTYGLGWTSTGLTWYLDGANKGSANIANSINSTEEFHRPFFAILNLAVGGYWPGAPNSSTPFPANMNIDWIAWN